LRIWLKATFVSIAAAVVAGWCTAGILIFGSMRSSDVESMDRRALANAALAAVAASLAPAVFGGLLGGVVAGIATARRHAQSGLAWCLKGAVLGCALGCAVSLLYGVLLGASPPWLMVFGVPGALAGGLAGAVVGSWCSGVVRAVGVVTLLVTVACSRESGPGLGEIMTLNQMRHAKLWRAGEAQNWSLAAYELDELQIMAEPMQEVRRAVESKDRDICCHVRWPDKGLQLMPPGDELRVQRGKAAH
jgi:hypothetical protein